MTQHYVLAVATVVGALGCSSRSVDDIARPPIDIARERSEYARWLETAPASPFRALLQFPLTDSVRLGPPGAEIPLDGVRPLAIHATNGRLRLRLSDETRPLARDRLVTIDGYRLLLSGPPGRTVLTVFGDESRHFKQPEYYPVSPAWRFEVALESADGPRMQRLLGSDGGEMEATHAGGVRLSVGGDEVLLTAYRMAAIGSEESELEIYFRDATNGAGTYPAGRFVSLVPMGGGRYVLDFNRARNAFCAYSAVYACPAPWRGNQVPVAIEAGERYSGGGLEIPPA